ncbi:hypothetical protein Cgig2_000104 [Carnegiea gigantea]|uniref:Uncharacterized protein n=1 Tax=Carnegiea gigantea TaxID=171969 RepID=A0A9Q1L0Q9_9CARY|nr:hypothetical protein Cgig2_000104 [Carnegiea gigantea]
MACTISGTWAACANYIAQYVVKCKGSKFGRRLDVALTDQQRLSLTYSAACAVSRKEGKEVVLPLEGPPANTAFVRGSAGREASACRSLRPLPSSYTSTGPQSNFRMAHITQSIAQLSGVIYNHGVKDYLHYLWGIGITSISRRHPEIKTGIETEVVQQKRPRAGV